MMLDEPNTDTEQTPVSATVHSCITQLTDKLCFASEGRGHYSSLYSVRVGLRGIFSPELHYITRLVSTYKIT